MFFTFHGFLHFCSVHIYFKIRFIFLFDWIWNVAKPNMIKLSCLNCNHNKPFNYKDAKSRFTLWIWYDITMVFPLKCFSYNWQNVSDSDAASDHIILTTVYPKKYAHGIVVLCFVVVMQSFIMNSHQVLSIFIRVALLALGQSLDCHSASEVSLMDMGKSVNV